MADKDITQADGVVTRYKDMTSFWAEQVYVAGQAATPAGEAHIGQIGGTTVVRNDSITRPANTDVYATGDAISDHLTEPTLAEIDNCARINAGSGMIYSARLVDSASQATKGIYEAWVFSEPIAVMNDNAAFTPTDAELLTLVAVIPFSVPFVGTATAGAGGNCVYAGDVVNRGFVCASGSKKLYWALVVRNAYTPVSAEAFTLVLTIGQD